MLYTVVMSGNDVCCSVVVGTLIGVFVFSVMWSELLLEFVSESVYVGLQYDEIFPTFTAGSVFLCGVSSPVVVLGLVVRLS